ncbi:hypothetical protein [Pseudomonas sp. R2-37-08W]|uniref:hypothetical protein n=1 Tax=Pseudomonas sp. R2-37-08W TaxID=1173273 RepID=UPI002115BC09|nr:hypothetical protein [Pseudomonas sp. R2-37-08W]
MQDLAGPAHLTAKSGGYTLMTQADAQDRQAARKVLVTVRPVIAWKSSPRVAPS